MIILKTTDTQFLISNGNERHFSAPESANDSINRCLVFLPCVTFGLAADIQIIVSTYKYNPVAFEKMPYRHTRGFMIFFAFFSLLQTLVTYGFCILVFGGINDDLRKWVFASFIGKALTWSPYLGIELYDTLFEQIYYDVNFQINYIKPDTSRATSPRSKFNKNGASAMM